MTSQSTESLTSMSSEATKTGGPLALPRFTFLRGGAEERRNALALRLAAQDQRVSVRDFAEPLRAATQAIFFPHDILIDLTQSPGPKIDIGWPQFTGDFIKNLERFMRERCGPYILGELAYKDWHEFGGSFAFYERFIWRDAEADHILPFLKRHEADCLLLDYSLNVPYPHMRRIVLVGSSVDDDLAQLRNELGEEAQP